MGTLYEFSRKGKKIIKTHYKIKKPGGADAPLVDYWKNVNECYSAIFANVPAIPV